MSDNIRFSLFRAVFLKVLKEIVSCSRESFGTCFGELGINFEDTNLHEKFEAIVNDFVSTVETKFSLYCEKENIEKKLGILDSISNCDSSETILIHQNEEALSTLLLENDKVTQRRSFENTTILYFY